MLSTGAIWTVFAAAQDRAANGADQRRVVENALDPPAPRRAPGVGHRLVSSVSRSTSGSTVAGVVLPSRSWRQASSPGPRSSPKSRVSDCEPIIMTSAARSSKRCQYRALGMVSRSTLMSIFGEHGGDGLCNALDPRCSGCWAPSWSPRSRRRIRPRPSGPSPCRGRSVGQARDHSRHSPAN